MSILLQQVIFEQYQSNTNAKGISVLKDFFWLLLLDAKFFTILWVPNLVLPIYGFHLILVPKPMRYQLSHPGWIQKQLFNFSMNPRSKLLWNWCNCIENKAGLWPVSRLQSIQVCQLKHGSSDVRAGNSRLKGSIPNWIQWDFASKYRAYLFHI